MGKLPSQERLGDPKCHAWVPCLILRYPRGLSVGALPTTAIHVQPGIISRIIPTVLCRAGPPHIGRIPPPSYTSPQHATVPTRRMTCAAHLS